jgi:phosphate transport system protein
VGDQLRRGFHRELDTIDGKVLHLFALVTEGLAAATDTFLASDRDMARAIVDADKLVDELYADIEVLVQRQLVLQAPVASELRYLLSVLRIVPELERSGDLVEHIASRAARGLGAELTPQVRGLVEQMGQRGVEMWRYAADAFAERDANAAEQLNRLDDRLDDLHTQLLTEISSGALGTAVAIEMALVGRFFERLGDHALHVTERVRYLAAGE